MDYLIKITSIKTTDEYPDFPDCVKNIEWEITFTNANGKTAIRKGGVNLGDPSADGYIPLANLDEATVVAWVDAQITRDKLLEYMMQSAEAEMTASEPILSEQALPWGDTT